MSEAIARRTTTDKVAEHLRQLIVSGELKPGVRLRPAELSQRLNVSPTPISQAIQRLMSEGLIENVPYRGAFVAQTSVQTLREILQVQKLLEGFAVEVATPQIPEDSLLNLRKRLSDLDSGIQEPDYDLHVEVDAEVHSLFLAYCGNDYLSQIMEGCRDRMQRVRVLVRERARAHLFEAHREHKAVIDAALRHDAPEARRLLEMHIEASERRLERLLLETLRNDGQDAQNGPTRVG